MVIKRVKPEEVVVGENKRYLVLYKEIWFSGRFETVAGYAKYIIMPSGRAYINSTKIAINDLEEIYELPDRSHANKKSRTQANRR